MEYVGVRALAQCVRPCVWCEERHVGCDCYRHGTQRWAGAKAGEEGEYVVLFDEAAGILLCLVRTVLVVEYDQFELFATEAAVTIGAREIEPRAPHVLLAQ